MLLIYSVIVLVFSYDWLNYWFSWLSGIELDIVSSFEVLFNNKLSVD